MKDLDIFIRNKLKNGQTQKKKKKIHFGRLEIDLEIQQIDEYTIEECNSELKTNSQEELKRYAEKVLKDGLVYPPVKNKEFQKSLGAHDAYSTINSIFTMFELSELAEIIVDFTDIRGHFSEVDKGLQD